MTHDVQMRVRIFLDVMSALRATNLTVGIHQTRQHERGLAPHMRYEQLCRLLDALSALRATDVTVGINVKVGLCGLCYSHEIRSTGWTRTDGP